MKELSRIFDLSAASYFADFFIVPPIAVAILIAAHRYGELELWRIAMLVIAGAILWSFAEYWIHRVLFHGSSRLAEMHEVHHAKPRDWIGVSSWLTLLAFGAVTAIMAPFIGRAVASVITSGLMFGYLFYCAIHVSIHHLDGRGFGPYGAMMLRMHHGHHRGGRSKFGVSSPLWDVIFRTMV